MSTPTSLRLQDLLRIALGAPEMTNVNITVLHSLIDILLKKLNCQDEKVTLSAYECESLNEILEAAKTPPLSFNDENLEMIDKKLSRLEDLEKNINTLDSKLNHHVQETKAFTKLQKNQCTWEDWAKHGCENICSVCDPKNEVACQLIKDTDFLKKLLRRIAAPMVDRIFILEDKVKLLHEEFNSFLKRLEDHYLKVDLLHCCIEEIEAMRIKINENHTQFLCTMEEVQDMMDSKMDKIHMPALKMYIRDRFTRIEEELDQLRVHQNCPRAAGIITSNDMYCLSCRSGNICSNITAETTPLLPNMTSNKKATLGKEKQRILSFASQALQKPTVHVRALKLNECITVHPSSSKQYQSDDSSTAIKSADGNGDLIEGLDGNLYRKG